MLTAFKTFRKYVRKPKNLGFCPICERRTIFIETDPWLRDHYICILCKSIPRQRALIQVMASQIPVYRTLAIHESSPGGPASAKLKRECSGYVQTHFFPDVEPGKFRRGFRCENLERMTFPDEAFDVVITQDVMEHVLNPDRAFAEIARTLKPGGVHIFTVPFYKGKKTKVRAVEENGVIRHLEKEVFHGNPIDKRGSLVVTDWGDELLGVIKKASELQTEHFSFEDRRRGLDAKFLDVFVSRKPAS